MVIFLFFFILNLILISFDKVLEIDSNNLKAWCKKEKAFRN